MISTATTSTDRYFAACHNVSVTHATGGPDPTVALDGVTFGVEARERVAIWGRSGSGKTTLLHVLGGLVEPTTGTVELDGVPLATLDAAARGTARRHRVAYVFQTPSLLPYFSAIENVRFAARTLPGNDRPSGEDLLTMVGLTQKRDHLPSELSGGEQQRVAIARALAQQPQLMLCDEPTGHLDSDTAERVLALIEALQQQAGFALVVATHSSDIVARFPRDVGLLDGRIIHEETHR